MLKVYLLVFILGICYGGYTYFTDMQNKILQLKENNAKLELVAETNQATITALQEDAAENEARAAELEKELKQAEVYQDTLIAKLRRHDLTKLTQQKPGLIEKRVNDASEKLRKELEGITNNPPPLTDSP